MDHIRHTAQRALFWSGLMLLAWPAYELAVRADAMIGPLKMFISMAMGEHVPLFRALGYVDWSIFATPAFLLNCVLLGLFALCLRKRFHGCLWLAPIAILLGLHGYFRQGFFLTEQLRLLGALPFVGVVAGCALHCVANIADTRLAKRRRVRPKAFPLKRSAE